jgi:hypothetical protein
MEAGQQEKRRKVGGRKRRSICDRKSSIRNIPVVQKSRGYKKETEKNILIVFYRQHHEYQIMDYSWDFKPL